MRVVTISRKPVDASVGTVARNALKWGCGGLSIDATRIGSDGGTSRGSQAPYPKKEDGTEDRSGSWARTGHEIVEIAAGRWPANLILSHLSGCVLVGHAYGTKNVETGAAVSEGLQLTHGAGLSGRSTTSVRETIETWDCVAECPVDALDNQSGDRPGFSGGGTAGAGFRVEYVHGAAKRTNLPATYYNDTGGASRYFKQISQEGDMTKVPQDLIDYLVTMISPPEPHPKAVFWDGFPDGMDLAMTEGNTLTGVILRLKSKSEPTEAQSKELLRILRPGAHLLLIAPDDQPTGHTAVCTVEDAGFEVRDAICWANEAGDGDRLHYVAKAARSEREAGCYDLPSKTGAEATDREEDTAGLNNPRAGAGRTANEVHNFHPCLHPEAVVMTDQGYRPIQDISLADRVFAADGAFHSVEAVTRHPYTSACLYKISVKGTNLTTLASDNHPFMIWRPRRKGNYIQGGDVIWASADQVVKGDYTMTPILQSGIGTKNWSSDPNFWFVFGLWLADGVPQKAGHGDNCYPSFSLHADETYLVDRIKSLTTKNVSVYEHEDNGIQVMVFDPDMGSDFKRLGGSGAGIKVIDPSVWLLNLECRKSLVDGYMAGDGGKVRTYIQAKSVSTSLASQITYLAESIGYKVCLYWFAAQPGKIGNRVFKKTLPTYQMQFYSDGMNQTTRKPVRPTRIDHEGVPYSLRYVQGVEKVPYQGGVVNLSVEGSHTFQTAVGMSHNTVKPIALMVRLLADVPKDEGPVLDPFLGCYDDQTEVLTRAGWKHFRDVGLPDWFLTRKGDQIEYQLATELHHYPFVGEMVHVHSRSTDLLVTPNHNMWVKTHADFCAGRDAQMIRADALEHNVYRIPSGGIYQAESQLLDRATMYLIGLYVSEGYLDSDTRYPNVIICQNRGVKWDQMEKWLAPFYPTTRGKRRISVRVPWSLYWFIEAHCGHSKYHKTLSPSILSNQHLDALFDAMMLGDGHVAKNDGSMQYWTVSPQLAGAFQELCVKLNKGSTLRVQSPKYGATMADGRAVHGTTDIFNICVTQSSHRKVLPSGHVQRESYAGDVFCVTVPNHTLYVRRNGRTAWCGNSGTTAIACVKTGHDFVGIEREGEFIAIATARTVYHKDKTYSRSDKWDEIQVVSDWKPPTPDKKPKAKKEKPKSAIEDLFG